MADSLEARRCDACGCSGMSEHLRVAEFLLWECSSCGFRAKESLHGIDVASAVYESGDWIRQREASKDYFRRSRRAMFAGFKPYLRPGSFLEVGPGDGWYMQVAQQNGFEVLGAETNELAVEYIEKLHGLQCHCGRLEEMGLEDASIDNVLVAHVIEHVPEPADLVREVYRVLRPGGSLIVKTPNAGGYTEALFGKRWSPYHTLDHVSFFTPESLRSLAAELGFRVRALWTGEAHFDFINMLIFCLRGGGHRVPGTSQECDASGGSSGAGSGRAWLRRALRGGCWVGSQTLGRVLQGAGPLGVGSELCAVFEKPEPS